MLRKQTKTFIQKDRGTVDQKVSRGFKEFCSGCKNINDQAIKRPKNLLQVIEANLVNSTQNISMVSHLHALSKSIWSSQIVSHKCKH